MQIAYYINPEDINFLILTIDEEPWKVVYKSLFLKYIKDLKSCKSITDLQERFISIEERLAKGEILRLLTVKNRLKVEIRQKLQIKGFSQEAIDKVIAYFEELGYLNDKEEVKRLIDSQKRKGYGPRRTQLLLKSKGLSREDLKEVQLDSSEQVEAIEKLLQKRFANKKRNTREDKAKLISALQRRGFELEYILKALSS